jgi:hypothetical protein
MSKIIIDRRDPRNSFAIVGDIHMTLGELAELLPDVKTPPLPGSKRLYVRLDYVPDLGWHHLTKQEGSQDLGPVPWPEGDRALLRVSELQSLLAALRTAKGHPEEGARRQVPERAVEPRV